jgi:uncharacterized SAM-binding protein YcdF (DUF218 family)
VFFADPSELFLPSSLYVVVFLLGLTVVAFRRRGARLGRLRYPLVAAAAWGYCFSTPAIANLLRTHLEASYPRTANPSPDPADGSDGPLIVVLSSAAVARRGGRDEPMLDLAGWERTWASIRLWQRVGGQLLFVGGPTADGRTSAAQRMAEVAAAAGVPASAVQVETRSSSTYENLLFSRDQIASREGHVWLVSSAVHLRRAMAVAHKLGLRVRPHACDWRGFEVMHWYAWLPNGGGPAMFLDSLHELMGLVYYRLKGYAD